MANRKKGNTDKTTSSDSLRRRNIWGMVWRGRCGEEEGILETVGRQIPQEWLSTKGEGERDRNGGLPGSRLTAWVRDIPFHEAGAPLGEDGEHLGRSLVGHVAGQEV